MSGLFDVFRQDREWFNEAKAQYNALQNELDGIYRKLEYEKKRHAEQMEIGQRMLREQELRNEQFLKILTTEKALEPPAPILISVEQAEKILTIPTKDVANVS